jgi:tagatose 1,6-diphosphate aldolase
LLQRGKLFHNILMDISIGKLRGLQRIAGTRGIFTMCAIDHRGSLEGKLCSGVAEFLCPESMTDFKLDLCRTLSPHASGVLLDPIFGAAQSIARSLPAKRAGILISLEETGYAGTDDSRETVLLTNWNVAKIKRMGADAVKLLVYYRPDVEASDRQMRLVAEVADQCRRWDILCVVEALSYPVHGDIDDTAQYARKKPELVIKTARDLTALPIDMYKAEFPADLHATHTVAEAHQLCRELNSACARPWVLLSAGTDYDIFKRQVEIACDSGASGFLAGRAIWQEAVGMDMSGRRDFLAVTAVNRLKKLSALARRYATPWQRKMGLDSEVLVHVPADWYRHYGEDLV